MGGKGLKKRKIYNFPLIKNQNGNLFHTLVFSQTLVHFTSFAATHISHWIYATDDYSIKVYCLHINIKCIAVGNIKFRSCTSCWFYTVIQCPGLRVLRNPTITIRRRNRLHPGIFAISFFQISCTAAYIPYEDRDIPLYRASNISKHLCLRL